MALIFLLSLAVFRKTTKKFCLGLKIFSEGGSELLILNLQLSLHSRILEQDWHERSLTQMPPAGTAEQKTAKCELI